MITWLLDLDKTFKKCLIVRHLSFFCNIYINAQVCNWLETYLISLYIGILWIIRKVIFDLFKSLLKRRITNKLRAYLVSDLGFKFQFLVFGEKSRQWNLIPKGVKSPSKFKEFRPPSQHGGVSSPHPLRD